MVFSSWFRKLGEMSLLSLPYIRGLFSVKKNPHGFLWIFILGCDKLEKTPYI